MNVMSVIGMPISPPRNPINSGCRKCGAVIHGGGFPCIDEGINGDWGAFAICYYVFGLVVRYIVIVYCALGLNRTLRHPHIGMYV